MIMRAARLVQRYPAETHFGIKQYKYKTIEMAQSEESELTEQQLLRRRTAKSELGQ